MPIKSTTMQRITRSRRPLDGRPAWHGAYRLCPGGAWCAVRNDAGYRIAYATPEAARKGAEFAGAAWRLAGPPRV